MRLIVLMMCFFSSFAYAQKYGVVDMQRIILSVGEGKSARAQLESEIKAKEAELQGKKTKLDKMNEDWKSQAALLSDEARLKKQQEFQQLFMELRNEELKFQNDIKSREGQATQKIAIKVAQMVEGMARKVKLAAVFETNSAGLLYLEEPIDLTPDIIKSYDSFKATGLDPQKKK